MGESRQPVVAGEIRPFIRRAGVTSGYIGRVGRVLAIAELLAWIGDQAHRMLDATQEKAGGLEVRIRLVSEPEDSTAARQRLEDIPVHRPQSEVEIRQLVARFSAEMAAKMYANMGKAHWQELPPSYLFDRMLEEVSELADAMLFGENGDIPAECADVANFAMMLRDRAG